MVSGKAKETVSVGSFSYTSFSLPDVAISLTSSFCPSGEGEEEPG
jgi:hypothetical protein